MATTENEELDIEAVRELFAGETPVMTSSTGASSRAATGHGCVATAYPIFEMREKRGGGGYTERRLGFVVLIENQSRWQGEETSYEAQVEKCSFNELESVLSRIHDTRFGDAEITRDSGANRVAERDRVYLHDIAKG